jgi:hypothetical protein
MGAFSVLDILRVGLSGLCFLLAFLAYRLISQEQARSGMPRGAILRSIHVFIVSNLAAGVLCAVSGYLVRAPATVEASAQTTGSYMLDYTFFLVDLTAWQPGGKGAVVVTRTDYIRKMTDKDEDYKLPSFTTGDRIDWEPITSTIRPRFTLRDESETPELKGHHYDFVLPVGRQPRGYMEQVSSKFTFPTGFKDPVNEWWQAYIGYPTKSVTVTIKFPDQKPCQSIDVSRITGLSKSEKIRDNSATILQDGRAASWTGLNEAGQTRIRFDWRWGS